MLYTIVPLEEIFQADCTANFETINKTAVTLTAQQNYKR